MCGNPRFWRNVTLIAVAHVVLIMGLIRWSVAARSAADAETLVWLSDAANLTAEKSESGAPPDKLSASPSDSQRLQPDKTEVERPSLAEARSEIELPKPTATGTPVPKAIPKPKTPPKPSLKPKPKKMVVAKASKSSARSKSSPSNSKEEQTDSIPDKKNESKIPRPKNASSSQTGAEKTGSAAKTGGHSGGGSSASEFGWYGNMLHDRFYSAWIQPTSTVASGTKISTLVKVRIEKDGRVSKFEIIKPPENVVVNESVAAIAKRVTEVDAPPTGLGSGDHYDVKINFELNTNQETVK
jgi:outer membrane biosynthesis protein TonB